jgi:hypothetical protein
MSLESGRAHGLTDEVGTGFAAFALVQNASDHALQMGGLGEQDELVDGSEFNLGDQA